MGLQLERFCVYKTKPVLGKGAGVGTHAPLAAGAQGFSWALGPKARTVRRWARGRGRASTLVPKSAPV